MKTFAASSSIGVLFYGSLLLGCSGSEPAPPPTAPDAAPLAARPGRKDARACETSDGECGSDADCSSNTPCGCRVGGRSQNICLTQSRCNVDADCPGRACHLSHPFIYANEDAGAFGGVLSGKDVGGMFRTEALGYFCTTSDDECVPGEPSDQGQIGDCVFSSTKNHWSVGTNP